MNESSKLHSAVWINIINYIIVSYVMYAFLHTPHTIMHTIAWCSKLSYLVG